MPLAIFKLEGRPYQEATATPAPVAAESTAEPAPSERPAWPAVVVAFLLVGIAVIAVGFWVGRRGGRPA
jgi:hypothetical protein